MQGNKSSGTKPELQLAAHIIPIFRGIEDGSGWPGKPDLVLGRRMSPIAIFVDGCYWHRCPLHGSKLPKKNRRFWMEKFEKNVRRDQRANKDLTEMGFYVVRVWECRIKNDITGVVRLIRNIDEHGRKRRIVRTRPWARR